MRRRGAVDALHGTAAESVECAFARGDERRRVTVRTLAPGEPAPVARPDVANWALSWPADGVALLRVSSFTVPRWHEWLQAAPEQRDPFLVEGRARIDAIVAELDERSRARAGDRSARQRRRH
jgi:hypothetical protein